MIFGYTENFYGYILASPVLLKVNLDNLYFLLELSNPFNFNFHLAKITMSQ